MPRLFQAHHGHHPGVDQRSGEGLGCRLDCESQTENQISANYQY